MIHLSAFSKNKIFSVKPKELKITRRYEDAEYAFVANDVKLECVDQQELYDAVTGGEDVSFIAYQDQTCKFRGTFQSESTGYDPETEIYSFTALHVAKKIFESAKKALFYPRWLNKGGQHNFDYIEDNFLYSKSICSVKLTRDGFENPWESTELLPFNPDLLNAAFEEFLKANPNYTLRDYWLDFTKHFRGIIYVSNDLAANQLPELNVIPRRVISQHVNSGYDDLIAGYNEQECDPQYKSVMFPCLAAVPASYGNIYMPYPGSEMISFPTPAFGRYYLDVSGGAILETLGMVPRPYGGTRIYAKHGDKIFVPESCLDLRAQIYGDTWKNFDVWRSLPVFRYALDAADNFSGESPLQYCERHFYELINPYKKVEVLYSELLPVNPLEKIAVRGVNVPISEIEDDLVNETTKITGRIFA